MDEKLKMIVERTKDERGKRIFYVPHCVLNENARWTGIAYRKGCIDEIVDELQKNDIAIVQMPCPEQLAWGGVIKQDSLRIMCTKGTLRYILRKLSFWKFYIKSLIVYNALAKRIVKQIKDYIDTGHEVVGIMGIKGSPSCGLNVALNLKQTWEYFAAMPLEKLSPRMYFEQNFMMPDSGLYVKALMKHLEKQKVNVQWYEEDWYWEGKYRDRLVRVTPPLFGLKVSAKDYIKKDRNEKEG